MVTALHHSIDVATFAEVAATTLATNDIGAVTLDLDKAVGTLPFTASTELGGFILIDRISHETVAFGFIDEAPRWAETDSRSPSAIATALTAMRLRIGPAGSLRRSELASLLGGNMLASLIPGGVVYGLTGSLASALLVGAADLLLRPLVLGGAWAGARKLRSRNQPASENVLGDGI